MLYLVLSSPMMIIIVTWLVSKMYYKLFTFIIYFNKSVVSTGEQLNVINELLEIMENKMHVLS